MESAEGLPSSWYVRKHIPYHSALPGKQAAGNTRAITGRTDYKWPPGTFNRSSQNPGRFGWHKGKLIGAGAATGVPRMNGHRVAGFHHFLRCQQRAIRGRVDWP